jgi:hypothetical protein
VTSQERLRSGWPAARPLGFLIGTHGFRWQRSITFVASRATIPGSRRRGRLTYLHARPSCGPLN